MRTAITFALSLTLLFTIASPTRAADPDVTLTLNNQPAQPGDYTKSQIQSLVISNGLLTLTFGKDANGDFSCTSAIKNGQELAHNLHGVEGRDVDAHRTFYLDYGAGRGHLVTDVIRIIKNTPDLAHFAVIDNHPLHLEHHFVMLRGESGIHPYVIIKTPPGNGGGRGGGGGEMRTMYRFDMDILNYAWTPERTGQQPKYALLQSISEKGNVADETWRLPDGSIYQKYDYSLYYAQAPMWGHYGVSNGHGYGVFFMPVSTESYAGGPLRDELAVHQDALILNYIGGGHYSGGGSATGRRQPDGSTAKIHGPWFLYFAAAPTADALIADALKTADAQKTQWPYQWMDEPLYPTHRTTVTGQLKISHNRSAANAYIILGQPANANARGDRTSGANVPDRATALYTQSGDYIYYIKADGQGKFTLPAVRPGSYTLYAWQTQGPITQSFAQDGITITGDAQDLGTLNWNPPYHPNLLWQIGQADRMSDEFKFGSSPRTNQWMNQVPANLTFTIGQSKEADDWYYAQKTGTWQVNFTLDKPPTGNAYLTIAIAGGGANVTASVNGKPVGHFNYGDDASVRRAANRSGRYGRNEFTFPAGDLKPGPNTLTLRADGAGIMYDTIVMEGD